MSKNSANSLAVEMQKIAAQAQIDVQRLANESTQKSFEYNTQEANTARTWQTQMSNTAHQREVADLKKAGLNPVLAANQGAQSYTTSSASAQANDPSGSIGQLAGNLIQSRTGAYQADVSASATRAAAAQAAAAQKYAARMNLQAANAAAYAQMYSADKAYQGKVESSPVARIGNGIRDIMKKTGLTEYLGSQFGKDVSFAKSFAKTNAYLKNPEAKNPWKVENLTLRGKAALTRELRANGFDFGTRYNMQVFLDAFINNKKSAQRTWAQLLRKSRYFSTQR